MLRNILAEGAEVVRIERVGVHSHIRGLKNGEGLIGQDRARRAASVVTQMAREGSAAGRSVLLSGRPGSGKTAIAMAVAKELGRDAPFTHVAASEIFSVEISKTEVLTQALRKSIALRIKETAEVIEGEVVALSIEKPSGPNAIKRGTMTLRTTDIESLYNLGVKMIGTKQVCPYPHSQITVSIYTHRHTVVCIHTHTHTVVCIHTHC